MQLAIKKSILMNKNEHNLQFETNKRHLIKIETILRQVTFSIKVRQTIKL